MTAYGQGVYRAEDKTLSIRITSLNRKALEVTMDLPPPLDSLEREILGYLKAKMKRGKVHLKAQLEETKQPSEASPPALKRLEGLQNLLEGLKTIAQHNGIPYQPKLDTLALLLACLPPPSRETLGLKDATAYHSFFFLALDQAFAAFEASRTQEGLALKADIVLHLCSLENASQAVSTLSQETVGHYRLKLFDRLKQAGLELDLQDERVLKELALFADRCDITEELIRLESHYQQFRAALEDSCNGSQKIGFLCQEIQREWNTIGSKANHLSITHHTLAAKLSLEKIKEQLQNLE